MPAPAPPPQIPPWPDGDLDAATAETINGLVDALWPRKQPRSWLRRKGLTWLLSHLDDHSGRTWQQKWLDSGFNDGHRRIRELTTGNLRLDGELGHSLYESWRAALQVRGDGQPRLSADGVLTNVRAFYLDIQGWAAQEPERWARWVAPSPIGSRETRSRAKAKRRAKERMDARIRTLQPLLPAFVAAATERRDHLHELLNAATDAEPDHQLTVGSKQYRRLFTAGDARHAQFHGRPNIRVLEESTGRAINLTFTEDAAFWQWAAVETLRHTGLRCEELLELSQLSIRQYARPNGEVVALLVVAPSKTEGERVIPMTPELFHVIATIIRRLTRNRQGVPLATRFDKLERITSEPQPFLFQRTIGQRTEVINPETLRAELAKLSDALAIEHPELAGCRFTRMTSAACSPRTL